MTTKTLLKYLLHHTEPEAKLVSDNLLQGAPWDHVVSVPARSEHELLPGLLTTLASTEAAQRGRILAILIINGNEKDSESQHTSNRQALADLKRIASPTQSIANSPPITLYPADGFDVLLVDRSEPPHLMGAKEGVGHVRKIGCDIALALYSRGLVKSPWLHNTDADARLPVDYFSLNDNTGEKERAASVFLYDHEHCPAEQADSDEQTWQALIQYELWLRYYVLGLRFAESPYAFHTIGSLLAIRAEDYAATRGFPRRQAAEDFYLLNKLKKVGAVRSRRGQPVKLLARESERVPFGTGQGTIKVKALLEQQLQYEVYHPAVFVALKSVLKAAHDALADNPVRFEAHLAAELASLPNSEQRRKATDTILAALPFEEALLGALNRSRHLTGARLQFHDWFDAFKTLKLVHGLRDQVFGSLPLTEALASASFLQSASPPLKESDPQAMLAIIRRLDQNSQFLHDT